MALHRICRRHIGYGVLLFICLTSRTATAQELLTLRNEVRTQDTADKADKRWISSAKPKDKSRARAVSFTRSDSNEECDEDDGAVSTLTSKALFLGLSSPFWAPRAAIGDDTTDPGYFLRYPYLHDRDAALVAHQTSPEAHRSWMLRARGEYADDFDSLSRIGGSLLFDTASRWGLDSEFNNFREDLLGSRDSLWSGDANIVYRFAQSEQLQMRTGIGLNWMDDPLDTDFGFNFTYAGDWYPTQPLIISHEIDWGKLGQATLFHGRITAGVNYHRLELYTGYDYLDVGQAELSGMVFGMRMWLSN